MATGIRFGTLEFAGHATGDPPCWTSYGHTSASLVEAQRCLQNVGLNSIRDCPAACQTVCVAIQRPTMPANLRRNRSLNASEQKGSALVLPILSGPAITGSRFNFQHIETTS